MSTGILNHSGVVHAIVIHQGLNVAACGEEGQPRLVTPLQIRVYGLATCGACTAALVDRARVAA